jgi:hypothetical protein
MNEEFLDMFRAGLAIQVARVCSSSPHRRIQCTIIPK